ncbi:uncharacterized protein BJ171DRAFT_517912 [Polychytrium aggregatum]|uniref:uncharacterized protein n=1 Tax=Polychytrium aggregatum TaxID=110093 RepID=UPI0022FDDE53|nr:uncharacterized protein BJ171DRAFT_517912 [Polychytrium aggregatum]KAI9199562.1 hypothetical protein BJ171DRAFT_517912 [Polychytrium aggregatum]
MSRLQSPRSGMGNDDRAVQRTLADLIRPSAAPKERRSEVSASDPHPKSEASKEPSSMQIDRPSTSGSCYCGRIKEPSYHPDFQCASCLSYFHQECIDVIKAWAEPPLPGDDYYLFRCKNCTNGPETIKRLLLSWMEVVHITLFNLTIASPTHAKYFQINPHICQFVEAHWHRFWTRTRGNTWKSSVSGCLSAGSRFASGIDTHREQGWWGLHSMNFPSAGETKKSKNVGYDIAENGSLLEVEIPKAIRRHRLDNSDSDNESQASSTRPQKKKGSSSRANSIGPDEAEAAKRKPAPRRPPKSKKNKPSDLDIDPATAIKLYPDIDNPKFPVRLHEMPTHSAPQMKITDNGTAVMNEKGYRMAKASHGVWEGYWYLEVLINSHPGHTRIGWSQISGDLQAPCGFDQFSYSFRDNPGTLFHKSKACPGPEGYASGYGPGDVIGMSIKLPKPRTMDDLLSRLWENRSLELRAYSTFPSKPMDVAEGAEIRYYKNGADLGVAFKGLYVGKYHPAFSCYMQGSVTVNFGPDFKYPLPEGAQPFSKVANEKTMLELQREMAQPAGDASSEGQPGTQ